jgi:large repetitive protein
MAAHKSLIATATSGAIVTVLVATAALISGGYTAQRLDLNDASVWVSNADEQFVGRANTQVFELNSVVRSTASNVEVVQRGSTVLLFDRSDAKLEIVDAATSSTTDSVALPPDKPEVYLAGSNVIIYSRGTGELWIMPTTALANFDADQPPNLNVGANSVVSVSQEGVLFAFSPVTGQVFRVDAANTAVVDQTWRTKLASSAGNYSITSVGENWAIFDSLTGQLETASGVTDLTASLRGGTNPLLQAPGPDEDGVLLAYSGGMLSISIRGGNVTELVQGRAGIPATPVVVAGCEFAAWSDGTGWRNCLDKSSDGTLLPLSGMPGNPNLLFQVNGDRALLNDAKAGASWAVQSKGEVIDNWKDLISVVLNQEQVDQNDESTPPETEQNELPPVAVDDSFGARPGRSSVLPVLLNDYDPNGDVLVITSVTGLDPALGRVDIINEAQSLQLTLGTDALGTISLTYSISDGKGGNASAHVAVDVRDPGENSAPVQVRATKAVVESGKQLSVPVLGDWIDPDGDPIYLSDAAVAAPDAVSHKADGTVIYSDSGSGLSVKTIILSVSDGLLESSGSLAVTVRASGQVPIIADPFVVLAYAGQETTIDPLSHVRGGTGVVRLNAVPPKSGASITPSYETGTFKFVSDGVGTHYLEYVVTDDFQTVTGILRVDVAAPPGSNTTPITVPKTVFIHTQSSETVDVASTDIDPAGGVLLVTGVMNVPSDSGIRAEILDQRAVRITLLDPLDAPVSFNYRISNGLAEAEGTITVVEIPAPTQLQAPIARDDIATARVGDAITIDVMANDEHPDGTSIRLNPVLVQGLSGDSGLLFASGNSLRYLAPDHTGNYSAIYEIIDAFGRTAQAQLTIQVREPNLDTNHAPVPVTITARVLAGERVLINVPLNGIDPDGDSVQLLGQETNPEKGAVIEVGPNYILYEAGKYSAATDTFTYTVIDALGARATGTVRVGITARLEGARNPVAIEDEVRARPGATVSVQVLANDSDPDGSALTVESVVPSESGSVVKIVNESIVEITPPTPEGSYGFVYTIKNAFGGTSSNFITVIVSSTAPLAYPVVSDTILSLSDILDRTSIDVDVLSKVFFADGSVNELGVSLLPNYSSTAEVLPNKKIRVSVGNKSQIIPFAVSHPKDGSIHSIAFIWVPGFDDALPQIDKRKAPLQVTSEETLTININDYVIAVGGKHVRLTDSSTVRATHSNGSPLVVDNDTLRFTSADLYFGLASISFEVTDGSSATDPAGRKAVLVLPITVNPRENQAPEFNGGSIEFQPGQQKVIDLVELTNYPYQNDIDELAYTVLDPRPIGFSYSLSGQKLTITANEDAEKGSTTAISLGVRDAVSDGKSGRIQLQIVPSTQPLAKPAPDFATARRGETTVIDVLDNDEATNPFPGEPLTVVAVSGADGGSLPPGISIVVSDGNSRLTVTVAANAEPVDANLQYEVSDATQDPDRYVWGSVRISVQDVPDAPAAPTRQATSFHNGELKLRFTPPQTNNSPITNYRVISSSQGQYAFDCGTTIICSLPGLDVGANYNFQVIASNAIGDSAPSPLSDSFSIDYLPDAPATVSAQPSSAANAPSGGSLDVNWSHVPNPNPGTAVVGYTVVVNGFGSFDISSPAITSTRVSGLATDQDYTVAVYARNNAPVISAADWNSTSTTAHTVGPPLAPDPVPQATSAPDGSIVVSWGASDPNGGGPVRYSVARVVGSATATSCASPPAKANNITSPWVDDTAVDGQTYTYFIYSNNGTYCSASGTGPTVSLTAPGQASGSASIADRGTGQFDIRAGTLSASGTVSKYQYLLSSDSTWRDVPSDKWVTTFGDPGATYGQSIDVTFRACRDDSDSFCGPASTATTLTPINARVTSASCDAAAPSPNPPLITAPANSGPVSVSYAISYNSTGLNNFNHSDSEDVPNNATIMRVKATVNGYVDPGSSGDIQCNH